MRTTILLLVALAGASFSVNPASAVCVDVGGAYCTVGAEMRAECSNGSGTGVFVAALGSWKEAACLRDGVIMVVPPRACVPDPSGEWPSLACALLECRWGDGVGASVAGGEVACVRVLS